MKTTTKLLGLSLAGAGLLMTACEVPGGGQPPRTIVIPNPTGDTPFSGFPTTFKGTTFVQPRTGDASAEGLLDSSDVFTTTVGEATDLTFTCDVGDEDTWVYVTSEDDDVLDIYCEGEGSYDVTVDGSTTVEIGSNGDPGLHPYVIRADLDETTEPTLS